MRTAIQGLGTYMRSVARVLSDEPLPVSHFTQYAVGADEPYVVMTLMRLAKRDIARRVDDQWVRGTAWRECADYYGWVDATQE